MLQLNIPTMLYKALFKRIYDKREEEWSTNPISFTKPALEERTRVLKEGIVEDIAAL
jgi:hypothetical protein